MFVEVIVEVIVLVGLLAVGVIAFVLVMKVFRWLRPKSKITGLSTHIINTTYGKGSGNGWATPISRNDDQKPS